MTTPSNEVTRSDVLVAIESLRGEVGALRDAQEVTNSMFAGSVRDHEERIRNNERSIYRGKGALGVLGGSMGLVVAAFTYLLKGGGS
jgi:hypothetical protein